jgi:predicted Zn-dependent protease with MMP-like domain
LNPRFRRVFDQSLEKVLEELPQPLKDLLAEVPVIAEDEPAGKVRDEVGLDDEDDLLGLHTGVPLTERSVEHSGTMPESIMVYRRGILDAVTDRHGRIDRQALHEQVRVTLLHEIGHHFGLTEQDLRRLGYG